MIEAERGISMKVLGMLLWTKRDKNENRIGAVEPLYDVTESEWRPILPSEFPIEGQIFWFKVDANISDGAFIVFTPVDNQPNLRYHFAVGDNPILLTEVIPLFKVNTEDQMRRMVRDGIHHAYSIGGPALLAAKGIAIGPIKLISCGPGKYDLEDGSLHSLPIYEIEELPYIRKIKVRGQDRMVIIDKLPCPKGHVDWDDDELVLRRALKIAVDVSKSSGDECTITKKVIDTASQCIANIAGDDAYLKVQRLTRAQNILKDLHQVEPLAKELSEVVLKHPEMAKLIKEATEEAKKEAVSRIGNELKAETEKIEDARKQNKGLESQNQALRKEIAELSAKAKKLKKEQTLQVGEVDKEISAQLEKVLRKPESLLAQASILRAVMRLPNTPGGSSSNLVEVRPTVEHWSIGSVILRESTDLKKRLSGAFKAVGLSPVIANGLHGSLCAGMVPIIGGSGARSALEAYASVVTGGRIKTIHVTPSLLDPGDVFGKVNPAKQRFVPHPDGLVDVVLAARESNGLMLVVMDGLNRAATESFFLPLTQIIRSVGRRLSLFHPSAVSSADPYFSLSCVDWPTNILLAATLVEGPTTLPISPDVWTDAILVQTDASEPPKTPAVTMDGISELEPASSLLRAREVNVEDEATSKILTGFEDGVNLATRMNRLASGIRTITSSSDIIVRELIRGILVPALASEPNDTTREVKVKNAAEAMGGEQGVNLAELVERARRRIA